MNSFLPFCNSLKAVCFSVYVKMRNLGKWDEYVIRPQCTFYVCVNTICCHALLLNKLSPLCTVESGTSRVTKENKTRRETDWKCGCFCTKDVWVVWTTATYCIYCLQSMRLYGSIKVDEWKLRELRPTPVVFSSACVFTTRCQKRTWRLKPTSWKTQEGDDVEERFHHTIP